VLSLHFLNGLRVIFHLKNDVLDLFGLHDLSDPPPKDQGNHHIFQRQECFPYSNQILAGIEASVELLDRGGAMVDVVPEHLRLDILDIEESFLDALSHFSHQDLPFHLLEEVVHLLQLEVPLPNQIPTHVLLDPLSAVSKVELGHGPLRHLVGVHWRVVLALRNLLSVIVLSVVSAGRVDEVFVLMLDV